MKFLPYFLIPTGAQNILKCNCWSIYYSDNSVFDLNRKYGCLGDTQSSDGNKKFWIKGDVKPENSDDFINVTEDYQECFLPLSL